MKKLVFMFLMAFAIIGFIGCNNNPVDVDLTEFVAAPTNLSISGTTLSWDAVEGAKGYIIYVNDEEEATVKTNSYNFGSLVGSVLIFKVQTQAPSGYKDSALSVSIAYMANKAQEITSINTVLSDQGMSSIPDGFAEELANKGMTSADLDALITAAMTFSEAVSAPGADMLDINAALKTFMETNLNVEALLSAVLVTVAPGAIDNQISQLEDQLASYVGYEEYYADTIAELESEILLYQNLATALSESDEATLLALTETINYLIAFQADIDNAFLTKIDDLVNDETMSFATLDPDEVIVIKNEFVAILRENIPTMEQMVLLFEVANIYSELMTSESETEIVFPDYTAKYAAQAILMFQAGIEFVDTFDLAFVTEVKTLGIDMSEDNPEMFGAELGILFTEYVDKYLNDNQDLMDQIDEVFTQAEKAEMFNVFLSSLDTLVPSQDVESGMSQSAIYMTLLEGIQNLTYEQVDAIYNIFDTASDALLNSFVETDGEIVRQIVIMNGYEYDYFEDSYQNYVLDEVYADFEEYDNARYLTQAQLFNEVLIHLGVVVDELTDDDITAIVDLLMVVLPFDALVDSEQLTTTQLATFKTNVENLLTEQLPNLLQLGKNAFKYISDEEMMDNLLAEMPDNPFTDENSMYFYVIFFADYYYGLMGTTNKNLVTDISSGVFTFMKTAEYRQLSGMLLTDITNVESAFNDALNFTISETNVFRNYNADPNALTLAQMNRIDSFGPALADFFMSE